MDRDETKARKKSRKTAIMSLAACELGFFILAIAFILSYTQWETWNTMWQRMVVLIVALIPLPAWVIFLRQQNRNL